MKNLFYSCYKYLPRYYTPSKFNDKLYTFPNLFYWEKYIANIDSFEEIEFIEKEVKKQQIKITKKKPKKENNYVIDKVDYIDYKNKYNL